MHGNRQTRCKTCCRTFARQPLIGGRWLHLDLHWGCKRFCQRQVNCGRKPIICTPVLLHCPAVFTQNGGQILRVAFHPERALAVGFTAGSKPFRHPLPSLDAAHLRVRWWLPFGDFNCHFILPPGATFIFGIRHVVQTTPLLSRPSAAR
jgi:hypothetical protein